MRVRAAAAIAITVFWGCKSRQEPEAWTSALASATPEVAPQGSVEPHSAASAAASAVVAIRDTTLPIMAPRAPAQRLVFGRGMLGELSADRLLIRSMLRPEQDKTFALSGGRALTALPSGALLAIDAEAVYRVDPGAAKPRSYKRVSFFPDSELLPERSDGQFFWVVHRVTQTALRYRLENSELPMLVSDVETKLEGYDGGAIEMSRDGVFVYSTAGGIARQVPRGKAVIFKPPVGSSGKAIWRLLPAGRLDQLWVVSEDGEVELWTLIPNAPLVRKFRVAERPYEAVAAADALAFVTVVQERGQARRFLALVYDGQGAERFRIELPNDPATSSENWLSNVTQNKGIAVSESEKKLAVGGPTWLGLWDLETGASLARP